MSVAVGMQWSSEVRCRKSGRARREQLVKVVSRK